MRTITRMHKLLTVTAATAIMLSTSAAGQSLWYESHNRSELTVDFVKPSFAMAYLDGRKLSELSSATFITFHGVVSPSVTVVAELPTAYASFRENDFPYYYYYEDAKSAFGIGNPYFGLRFSPPGSGFSSEVGLRAPLATDNAYVAEIGSFADYDRFTAFLHNITSARGVAEYRYRMPSGAFVQFAGGGLVAIPDEGDAELFGQYGIFVGATGDLLTVKTGVTGIMLITESAPNFSERTLHQLGLTADFDLGAVRPAVQIRVPLDEDMETYRYALGFGLSYGFN